MNVLSITITTAIFGLIALMMVALRVSRRTVVIAAATTIATIITIAAGIFSTMTS
jgi:hypothetical protein